MKKHQFPITKQQNTSNVDISIGYSANSGRNLDLTTPKKCVKPTKARNVIKVSVGKDTPKHANG